MDDAEYYRAQAGFCAHMAESALTPEDKDRRVKLAEKWREPAKELRPRRLR